MLAAASKCSDMDDWVLDSLVGFLKSPTWTIPRNSFTDHNCVGKSYLATTRLWRNEMSNIAAYKATFSTLTYCIDHDCSV